MSGARCPEELEMLFEDALVAGDIDALRDIFEASAIVVTATGAELRGCDEIASGPHEPFAAGRARVLQSGRTALLIGPRTISVVRRGPDRSWRYAISVRTA